MTCIFEKKMTCYKTITIISQVQGDPKQTDTFEMATTLLWVDSGKKLN